MIYEVRRGGVSLGAVDPASSACAAAGGTERVENTPAGQLGICVLPDGSECESWALYRNGGTCPTSSGPVVTPPTGLLRAVLWTAAGALVLVLVFNRKRVFR